uniref:CD63 antigen n=1 Tax=Aceria tosichella TaxID=561515 RepID=A0A6G1SN79_9ACAR
MVEFSSKFCGYCATIMLTLARLILFIWCFQLAFVAIALMLVANEINFEDKINGIEKPELVLLVYMGLGALVAIALIGIVATYTRDRKHLSMFGLIPACAALLGAAGTYMKYMHRDGRGREFARFNKTMSAAMGNYMWYGAGVNEATDLWDNVQEKLKCCGLLGSQDWSRWRPSGMLKSVLPASCCSTMARTFAPHGRCFTYHAYSSGCLARHELIKEENIAHRLLPILLGLVLMVVLTFSIAKRRSAPSNGSQHQTDKYSAVENAAYVRRSGRDQEQEDERPLVVSE